jgi:hypothetical protein
MLIISGENLITCARDEVEVTESEMNVENEVTNKEIEIQKTTNESNTVGEY